MSNRMARVREKEEASWSEKGKQTSDEKILNKYKNEEKWQTAVLTITCCHTNPIGKFTVVPNKNIHCVNSMGNTKHKSSSH